MADTTKINNVQENLIKAMGIISAQSLKEVSFDKTIVCTIKDDKDKKEGKYTVSDGTTIFTAYSSDTSYHSGAAVYVTIPEGDYNNQKIIIGKKTATTNTPYVIEQPFDTIFDLTGNLYELPEGATDEYGLTANAPNNHTTIAEINDLELSDYSKLGLKASFRTYLSEAIKGKYGLQLAITFKSDNGQERIESFELNNSEMFGNSYNFETYYEQQEVVNIENLGIITKIRVDLYQNRDFYNKDTQYLKCSTDGYKTDSEKLPIIGDDGFYIPDGEMLGNNIFVKDLFICAGDDASKFVTDYVELYTKGSKHYNKSDEKQEKTVDMRWIHVGDTKTDIIAAAENETIPKEDTYEVRWYRYSIGMAAADEYCGVYWDRINPATGERIYWYNGKDEEEYLTQVANLNAEQQEKEKTINDDNSLSDEEKNIKIEEIKEHCNELIAELDKLYEAKSHWYSETTDNIELDLHSFSCKFTPNCLKNNEKIKVIAFYNGVAYRGNAEMLFENDEEVFDASSAIFVNALQITPADGTNGNYLIYGQNASLRDSEESKKTRTLTAYFDTNSDGTAESLIQPNENLAWVFPVESTMIKVLSETIKEYKEIALSADEWQSGRYYYEEYKEITLTANDWVSGQYYYKENEEYKLDTSIKKTDAKQYYEKTYTLDNNTTFVARNYYKLVDTGEVKDKSINPIYSIDKTYSSSKSNNTIYCRYTLEGITYTSEKEFTFGPKGTMGTDQTIVIDFVGDDNAIIMGDGPDTYKLQVQLYDEANFLRTDISNITWGWYYRSSEGLSLSDINSSIVTVTKTKDLSIDDLFIIKVTVGDLETYFPLPIKKLGYSYITGPTQVIYKADGSADYSKEAYSIYETSLDIGWRTRFDIQKKDREGNVILPANKYYISANNDNDIAQYKNKEWMTEFSDEDGLSKVLQQMRYIGNVEKNFNDEYNLNPLAIYVEDSLIYGVQACYEDYVLWTQPILVLQNKWASNVINKWDGKSLVLDEVNSSIIASSIAAGKKNNDNTFSGVMMGDWSGTDSGKEITNQTGVYGFDHGSMSYALTEDGKAFFGKDGNGRIYIDGNSATLQSADWLNHEKGMKIDLDEPSIFMTRYTKEERERRTNFISIDASKTGNISSANSTSAPFKIGEQFAVDWDGTLYANNGHFQGEITGEYGQIGQWIIGNKLQSEAYNGGLYNSNKTIILNPKGNGSIILGEDTLNRIVIDAAGSGTIQMGKESVLTGGIIKAGTLKSNTGNDSAIVLEGYLTVGNGTLGYVSSGVSGSDSDDNGIGLTYDSAAAVKATGSNAGLYYKTLKSQSYVSVENQQIVIGIDESGTSNNKAVGRLILSQEETQSVSTQNGYLYCTVAAEHQKGIYARFA